jgi:hypothetical protein
MNHPYEAVRRGIQATETFKKREQIIKELTEVINRNFLENDSNTPDFIIGEYLWDCLMTQIILTVGRAVWYNPTNNGKFPQFGETK